MDFVGKCAVLENTKPLALVVCVGIYYFLWYKYCTIGPKFCTLDSLFFF